MKLVALFIILVCALEVLEASLWFQHKPSPKSPLPKGITKSFSGHSNKRRKPVIDRLPLLSRRRLADESSNMTNTTDAYTLDVNCGDLVGTACINKIINNIDEYINATTIGASKRILIAEIKRSGTEVAKAF